MSEANTAEPKLIEGEFSRKMGERFRLTLPGEFKEVFSPEQGKCVIAKEQPGCLSLWDAGQWKSELDGRLGRFIKRYQLGDLKNADIQKFGRLLSTRHKEVQLAERSRLVLPEGFREFLGVEEGGEVMIVGAIRCVELWNPKNWFEYIGNNIADFSSLLDTLSA